MRYHFDTADESAAHAGSVQIYPAQALERIP